MAPDFSIARIHAREVLDSRGNPTVEVEVTLADVAIGLDVAATEFFRDGRYTLHREGRELTTGEMVELLTGRKVLVYATHSGTGDITERMEDFLTRHGF